MHSQPALLTVLLSHAVFDMQLEGTCRLLKLSDYQGAWLKNRENGSFTGTFGASFGQLRCAGESEKLLLVL